MCVRYEISTDRRNKEESLFEKNKLRDEQQERREKRSLLLRDLGTEMEQVREQVTKPIYLMMTRLTIIRVAAGSTRYGRIIHVFSACATLGKCHHVCNTCARCA